MVSLELTYTELTGPGAFRARKSARRLGCKFENDGRYALLTIPHKDWRQWYRRFCVEAGLVGEVTNVQATT